MSAPCSARTGAVAFTVSFVFRVSTPSSANLQITKTIKGLCLSCIFLLRYPSSNSFSAAFSTSTPSNQANSALLGHHKGLFCCIYWVACPWIGRKIDKVFHSFTRKSWPRRYSWPNSMHGPACPAQCGHDDQVRHPFGAQRNVLCHGGPALPDGQQGSRNYWKNMAMWNLR